jgi:hypothetical protein
MTGKRLRVEHGNRTDPIRPAVFDPATVEVVGFLDTNPPKPPSFADLSFGMPADLARTVWDSVMEDVQSARKEWEQRNLDWFGERYPGHQCDHCGARIRWAYVVRYLPTGEHFLTGETCGQERMELANREAFDVRAAKLAAESAKVRIENLRLKMKWASDYPVEAEWIVSKEVSELSPFMQDLRAKLERYGSLSEKQTACITREIPKVKEREQKRAAEAAALANAPKVESGRYEIEGEIVFSKWQESDFGDTLKIMIKTEEGNKFWCSAPSKLFDGRDTAEFVGEKIRVAATWEPSEKDEHFAFGKRPTLKEVSA